jgi:hypothetical protein
VDVIVLDAALAGRRAKVPGTMVHRALREGRVPPNPEQVEYAKMFKRIAAGDLVFCRKLVHDS